MKASLRYIRSVLVLLLCVQAGQPVPTTNLLNLPAVPLITTTTGNQQSKTLIKANDSLQIDNHKREILSVDIKGNEKATTSTTTENEATPILVDGTTESSERGNTDASDPMPSEMAESLLPNATSDTTHIEIVLDAQDVTTEGIEERTAAFEDSRTDTTPRNGKLPPQDMSTENNTRETKDSTTTDQNVTGRTQSNNTEEMNSFTKALSNTAETTKPKLEDGQVPTKPDNLVKCYCGQMEVQTKDGCQPYQDDTLITFEDTDFIKYQVRNCFSLFVT